MSGSKLSGYQDFEWAVKLNRISLNLIGLWPVNAENFRQKFLRNLRVLFVFLGITIGLVVPCLHSLIRIHKDVLLMIDNLQYTLPLITSSIRIAIFWWKKKAIVPIMNMIQEDWIEAKSSEERTVMIRRARWARIIITCAYCTMGAAFVFIVVLPYFGVTARIMSNMTDPGRPLLIQAYYIYDMTKRPYCALTFVSQSVYTSLALICYTAIDNFLGLLIFHICGQLDILIYRLTRLNEYINIPEALRSCVKKHIRLLRAISVIEDTYNIMLLLLFVYFGIMFAFYGFSIINVFDRANDESIIRLISHICFIGNAFAHMCLYCALGDILLAQCNKIYYAVYSCKWYSIDPKISKELLHVLSRGSKPVYLTAGKIFPLTMITFCNLIKTSAGYISVLHTTRNVDFEWAVKLNRISLDFVGLWPVTDKSSSQMLLCNLRVLFIFLGITAGLVIPCLHALTKIYWDAMLMIENLQYTLPAISSSIRIIIFWWKKKAMVPVMKMIEEDWLESKSLEERSFMIKRAQCARILVTCAYCMMASAYVLIVVLPCFGVNTRITTNITDFGKPLPLQTYYIYDVTKRPQYELTFISQSIYSIFALVCYTAIDNFLGLIVFHICGQMDILKHRLAHLNEYINFHEMLKECVKKHIRLLRAIAVLEDTYNITLLILFAYFAIIFAFYGCRVMNIFDGTNDLPLIRVIFLICIIISAFAHMLLYCALGEILLAQCNEIYYATYSSEWYTTSPKTAKELLPVLAKGIKPMCLTVGKMFPLTMATFCNLIKTSAGYMSVLHTTKSY